MQRFERIIACAGITNAGVVLACPGEGSPGSFSDHILRSAAPYSYEDIARQGIKTTLNLQTGSEKKQDDTVGIKEIWMPLAVWESIPPAKFNSIIKLMQNEANYPLLIHCAQGHDRTGVVVATWRMKIGGWTWGEAMEEMKAYGYDILTVPLLLSLRDWAKGEGIQGVTLQ